MNVIKRLILSNKEMFSFVLKLYALLNKVDKVNVGETAIEIYKNNKKFLIAKTSRVYAFDVIREFDYYTNSIAGIQEGDLIIYDFTEIKSHKLKKENIDFYYTGLPEGSETNEIYSKFLNLKDENIILDLGSYCGYSSYLFSKAVKENGKVICVEADKSNYCALTKNVQNLSLTNVITINKAIWDTKTSLDFACESSMGSFVKNCGNREIETIKVKTTTLSDIANGFNLQKIDAIKMDIEGSEYQVFSNIDDFIDKFSPKFIIEIHKNKSGKIDINYFKNILEKHSYNVINIKQSEKEKFPLLYAEPKQK